MSYLRWFTLKIFLIVVPVLLVTGTPDGKEKASCHGELRKGLVFLNQNNPDSAIKFLILSYSKGLSRDSLFYYWSEAFLQKGILDSSLGANLIISGNTSGLFQIQVLQQRYRIYKRLGWMNDAQKVADSLHKLPSYRHRLMIPDIETYLHAGARREQNITDTSFPWGTWGSNSKVMKETGYDGDFGIGLKWRIPRKQNTVSWGINALLSKTTADAIVLDTSDIKSSLFASLSNSKLSATYSLSLNRRIDDTLLVGNSMEFTMRGRGKLIPMLWSGISVQVNSKAQFNNGQFWLLSSLYQYITKKIQINYLMYSSLFYQPPTVFSSNDTLSVLYAEDGSLQYPVFYTNSTYSEIIDTSNFNIINAIRLANNIKSSGSDSILTRVLNIPNSSISFNPKAVISFKSVVPMELGLSYAFLYYWEPYIWDNITCYTGYIVFSRKDSEYYRTQSITVTRSENGGISLAQTLQKGGFSLVHNKKVRIDNAISTRFTVGIVDNDFLNMKVSLFCSKNWSNLKGIVPIEIPDWLISAQVGFSLKVRNKSNSI